MLPVGEHALDIPSIFFVFAPLLWFGGFHHGYSTSRHILRPASPKLTLIDPRNPALGDDPPSFSLLPPASLSPHRSDGSLAGKLPLPVPARSFARRGIQPGEAAPSLLCPLKRSRRLSPLPTASSLVYRLSNHPLSFLVRPGYPSTCPPALL